MKVKVEIPESLVARVDRALRAEGLEVREFVKAGDFRLEVANAIGGVPGVPRLISFDGPRLPGESQAHARDRLAWERLGPLWADAA